MPRCPGCGRCSDCGGYPPPVVVPFGPSPYAPYYPTPPVPQPWPVVYRLTVGTGVAPLTVGTGVAPLTVGDSIGG